jgi:NAD-dependent deacetylase
MNDNLNKQLVEFLKRAEKILIFTGAGVSTGSGIPDFRGPRGIWKTSTPVLYRDFMNSEEARIEYWNQKAERWKQYKNAQPNDVHRSVVLLEKANKLLKVVTQNIDGLHLKAGTSLSRLVELHGTMSGVVCQSCHSRYEPDDYFTEFYKTGKSPLCSCGGYIKSATISFGQNLRPEDLEAAFQAALEADLVVALGSTLSVTPAANVPLHAAMRGIPYVIVNRGPTEHDPYREVSLRLEGDVGEIFPKAVKRALQGR